MVMNVKALRHHGSVITPPPPVESPSPVAQVLVRYFVDGVTPVDTVADGSQIFPYPDGPFQYYILTAMGGNPPALDWIFNSSSGELFNTLLADTVNLGGPLSTVARINMLFGLWPSGGGTNFTSIYDGTTFEAQAYEHDPIFPFSRAYGPLLTFSCQPTLHDPVYLGPWYTNRYSRYLGFHEIDSAGLDLKYPSGWSTAEEVNQGNLILLPTGSILWGTLSRLTWAVTQLGGTPRKMSMFGFAYPFSTNSPAGMASLIGREPPGAPTPQPRLNAIEDLVPVPDETGWASGWMTFDTYAGMAGAPHPFQPFVFIERFEEGFPYAGTSYSVQAKFNGVDFGPPVIIQCEV